jgi:hypothetical protein
MIRAYHFWALCLIGLMTQQSLAYEQDTHRELSKSSSQQSVLAATTNNVLADLGLSTDITLLSQQKFPNSKGEMQSIIGLIQDGADFEDNSIRSVQHFYDPVNDRSLQHPLLTIAGGTNKSPDWAIEDTGAISAQEYSYADAVEIFHQALTLPTKTERDAKWGKLFETLGHVIHHVQDMAQPEHVRNDLHCGEVVPCGIPGAVLGLYDQSLFESRSFEVFKDGIPANLINYPAVSFPTAREFWTTRGADGSVSARRGLADFTNRNFVSKDTNFELISGAVSANSKYSLPAPIVDPTNTYSLSQLLPSEGADICQTLNQNGPIDLPANAPCEIEFIKSTVTDSYAPEQGGTNLYAASLSLFDQYLDKYNVNNVFVQDGDAVHMVDVDRLPTINRFNIDAAHTFLIPRAVAYSAGLIDHFFKARIKAHGSDGVILVTNPNTFEIMGSFELWSESSSGFRRLEITSEQALAPGAAFSMDYNASAMQNGSIAYVVFIGQISGQSERAVAAKQVNLGYFIYREPTEWLIWEPIDFLQGGSHYVSGHSKGRIRTYYAQHGMFILEARDIEYQITASPPQFITSGTMSITVSYSLVESAPESAEWFVLPAPFGKQGNAIMATDTFDLHGADNQCGARFVPLHAFGAPASYVIPPEGGFTFSHSTEIGVSNDFPCLIDSQATNKTLYLLPDPAP